MTGMIRMLGKVKLVQLQPNGLIINTSTGSFYDVSRRVEVNSIEITSQGIEATTPAGEHVLDIHHLKHPDKAYDENDLVCIGFTSHYDAMRKRFGKHMKDGVAGENIIIEYDQEVWMDDLGRQIVIENSASGLRTFFDISRYAAPCKSFSKFVLQKQLKNPPTAELKSTLQFLDNGRRGFLLGLASGQEKAIVQAGDKVFAILEYE